MVKYMCVLLTHIGSLRSVFAVSLEFGIVLDVDDLGGKQRFDRHLGLVEPFPMPKFCELWVELPCLLLNDPSSLT